MAEGDGGFARGPEDDLVATFQIDGEPVRGRIVRLGPDTIEAILQRHPAPAPVQALVGEALAIAALVGASLKFDGRLIMQTTSHGAAPLLVAEFSTKGHLRAYVRIEEERLAAQLTTEGPHPSGMDILGEGVFAITLDQGPDMERYQGITPLEGESLSICAERYFATSEQVPTKIKVAVGIASDADGRERWRAGGVLVQRIAGDSARGDADDAFDRASAHVATLQDEELLDPALGAPQVLYRLFHEDGVRMAPALALVDACHCTAERLAAILRQFGEEDLRDMLEPDGRYHAKCEFCGRRYALAPQEVTTGAA